MGRQDVFLFPGSSEAVYPLRPKLTGWGWSPGGRQGRVVEAVGPAVA